MGSLFKNLQGKVDIKFSKMEASDGDTRVVSDIKTRSQKKKLGTVDEDLLKSVDDTDPEVQALVHDQIFFNFVQKTNDPDHGPLSEDLADSEDFVPNEESVLEAEDGGSSEDELDDEEATNPSTEAEIAEVNLEAADSIVNMLKNAPPALAETYKKRFPIFWRMQQGLRAHTGNGYDHEEDPAFEIKEREEEPGEDTIELLSSDSESSSSDEEEDEMVNEEEMVKLTSMVEDMVIPADDSVIEVPVIPKSLSPVEEVEIEDSESEDETETKDPSFSDLADPSKDMIYEDDIPYEPVEVDVQSSDDSYISAKDDDSEESSDGESDEENMDE